MKAKKTVWKMFIEKVKNVEGMEVEDLREQDYNDLAKRNINGRQIKNLTRAAQALAVHEDKPLSMSHIKRVLEVAETFEMDLKGEFLARSYFMCGFLNANVLLRWHRLYGRNERIHLSAVVGDLLAIFWIYTIPYYFVGRALAAELVIQTRTVKLRIYYHSTSFVTYSWSKWLHCF